MSEVIKKPHEWTHDGDKVLLLKCVNKDGTSYGGFQWPLTVGESVEAPDWNPTPECGGGLHGWPWGLAMGDGTAPDYSAQWLAFSADPAEVVNLGGKAKTKRATIVASGTYLECHLTVLKGQIAWTQHASNGAASATGCRGAASATGENGAASATGWRGIAAVTNDECRVECGADGMCAACADVVYWTIRRGAVLAQRTSKGSFLVLADDWVCDDGETVLVEHGVIWQDWQEN